MAIVRCEHCGLRFEEGVARCPSCGAPNRRHAAAGAAPRRTGSPRGVLLVAGVAAAVGLFGALAAGVFLLAPASSSAPTSPSPASPAAARPAPVPADATLAAIRARGTLRVAADPEAPPFLVQTDTGWEGFEYALMSAIAGQLGARVEVVPTAFPVLLDAVGKGEADLAIGQLSPMDTARRVAWSSSYLQYSLCLVTRAGGPVRGRGDLAGRTVGRWDDPVAEGVLGAALPSAVAKVYTDYGYFEDLAAGRIDAVLYDCPLTRHELKRHGASLRVVDASLSVSSYAVAMRQDDVALRERVDTILRDLGNQGLLASLADRWLGEGAQADGARATGAVVVVRAGETLEDLAARVGRAPGVLHDANRDVVGADPGNLYAGMVLRVPAS